MLETLENLINRKFISSFYDICRRLKPQLSSIVLMRFRNISRTKSENAANENIRLSWVGEQRLLVVSMCLGSFAACMRGNDRKTTMWMKIWHARIVVHLARFAFHLFQHIADFKLANTSVKVKKEYHVQLITQPLN